MLGAAFDHLQQPGLAGPGADRGEVDDHGDVLFAAAGVPPDVLIDPDHGDAVEPGGVVDQDMPALGQHGVVRGVPRHPQAFGGPGHGQVLDHDPFQCPPQALGGKASPAVRRPGWCPAARRVRSRRNGSGGW